MVLAGFVFFLYHTVLVCLKITLCVFSLFSLFRWISKFGSTYCQKSEYFCISEFLITHWFSKNFLNRPEHSILWKFRIVFCNQSASQFQKTSEVKEPSALASRCKRRPVVLVTVFFGCFFKNHLFDISQHEIWIHSLDISKFFDPHWSKFEIKKNICF